MLKKTIAGYLRHPNFFGILFIGLGCETNNISSYVKKKINNNFFYSYNIQNCGGTQKAIQVYVAGELQTSGYAVTNTDPVVISFDTPPADGSEVTILVKFGVTWYAPGVNPPTASNGEPLQETNTIPALFLRGIN
jgi:altronate dehydratase